MSERVLYLDLVGGAAGDMILGALLDLGAPFQLVREALDAVGLTDVRIEKKEVYPASLRALQVDVFVGGQLADGTTVEGTPTIRTPDEAWAQTRAPTSDDQQIVTKTKNESTQGRVGREVEDHHHHHHHHAHGRGHRAWKTIRDQLAQSSLSANAKRIAQDAFRRLAEAESLAHGIPIDEVEFHEVGSDDAIADIVGVAVAFDSLKIGRVVSSPLPLGRCLSRGAHGPLPIPGPATLHILRGAPTIETPLQSETVTPTGAALVRTLADDFGAIPSMVLEGVGVGAGHKSWPDRPNVVRAILGEVSTVTHPGVTPKPEPDVVQVETNLDDMSPEHFEVLFAALFEAGAVDVWANSATFKKGRTGWVVSALAPPTCEPAVSRAFFRNSPTLGVRSWMTQRRRLARTIETVVTPFGDIRVKRSSRPGAPDHVKPEHDDVRAAARAAKVPLRVVEEAALRAAWHDDGREG